MKAGLAVTTKDNEPDLFILSDPARSTTSNLLFRIMGMPLPPSISTALLFSWEVVISSILLLTALRT